MLRLVFSWLLCTLSLPHCGFRLKFFMQLYHSRTKQVEHTASTNTLSALHLQCKVVQIQNSVHRPMLPNPVRLTSAAFTRKSVSSLRAHAVYTRVGCAVFNELTAGTTVFWSTVAVVSENSKELVCYTVVVHWQCRPSTSMST